tara:strand:+ start:1091 stop:1654 length:564 start_codon:yes stop_codon:yes gene_type:complete
MQIKNLVIGAAITFLTFLVIFTGMQTFYPNPEYTDFCEEINPRSPKLAQDRAICAEDAMQCPDGTFVGRDPSNNCEFFDCEQLEKEKQCQDNYENARETYSKTLFIITLILGIILLLLGGKLFNLEAVGAGIMGGGGITIFYGSTSYWQFAGDLFRFIISIIALITVIYIAYWLNNKIHRPKIKKKK